MSALSAELSTHVGRHREIGDASFTECTGQGNDFELIPTVEMETRYLVDGYIASEFPVICNHCGVMAAWSCKTLKIFEKFLRFLEKRPITVKLSKFYFETFHRDANRRVVFKFRETWPTGNRWNRALLTCPKNFAWLSSCRYCAVRAKNPYFRAE